MCKDLPGVKVGSLDEVLVYFEEEPRDEDANHNAVLDAQLCGKVYMHYMKMFPLKKSPLGFVEEWMCVYVTDVCKWIASIVKGLNILMNKSIHSDHLQYILINLITGANES